jgi:hypothetical protein
MVPVDASVCKALMAFRGGQLPNLGFDPSSRNVTRGDFLQTIRVPGWGSCILGILRVRSKVIEPFETSISMST